MGVWLSELERACVGAQLWDAEGAEAASAEGGHTRIHFEAGGKRKAGALSSAYDTTTPGHALLFRKDLDHEGEPLLKGVKNILSLNLLAYRKRTSNQVLVVEFEPSAAARTADETEPVEPPSKQIRVEAGDDGGVARRDKVEQRLRAPHHRHELLAGGARD